ncbi:MAG: hypothetical protein IOC90_10370 [Methylocystis sp.]|nr:hypothetical protein [Methylocystis sp.]MCA3583923.1 hypothetical protein [Methylocystis sp.]MCA3588422.1 hypothetical protein [Methylocystis sp.]MCA3592427.1 hypothetical protein [Methylocystis sp.]
MAEIKAPSRHAASKLELTANIDSSEFRRQKATGSLPLDTYMSDQFARREFNMLAEILRQYEITGDPEAAFDAATRILAETSEIAFAAVVANSKRLAHIEAAGDRIDRLIKENAAGIEALVRVDEP